MTKEEINLLNETISNQHNLIVNAEQRGIDKSKEELKEKDAEIERLNDIIWIMYSQVENLKMCIDEPATSVSTFKTTYKL